MINLPRGNGSESFFCIAEDKEIGLKECLDRGRNPEFHRANCIICDYSPYRLCGDCVNEGIKNPKHLDAFNVYYRCYLPEEGEELCPGHNGGGNGNNGGSPVSEESFFCPIYNKEISHFRCLNNNAEPKRNRKVCAEAYCCRSPWRLCIECVKQKPVGFRFSQNPLLERECRVRDFKKGFCRDHTENKDFRRDWELAVERKTSESKQKKEVQLVKKFNSMSHSERISAVSDVVASGKGKVTEIAKTLDIDTFTASDYRLLLNLVPVGIKMLENDAISMASARILCKQEPNIQRKLLNSIAVKSISKHKASRLIKNELEKSNGKRPVVAGKTDDDAKGKVEALGHEEGIGETKKDASAAAAPPPSGAVTEQKFIPATITTTGHEQTTEVIIQLPGFTVSIRQTHSRN